MVDGVFTLPSDSFVGGQVRECRWALFDKAGRAYFTGDWTGTFTLVNYSDRNGAILIRKPLLYLEEGNLRNIAYVKLTENDTRDLYGRYIYQLTVRDYMGNCEIPGQGIFVIAHNIERV